MAEIAAAPAEQRLRRSAVQVDVRVVRKTCAPFGRPNACYVSSSMRRYFHASIRFMDVRNSLILRAGFEASLSLVRAQESDEDVSRQVTSFSELHQSVRTGSSS